MPTLSSPPAPISTSSDTAAEATEFETTIIRRKTRPVKVGDVTIGGGHPVVVQSMINEDTLDIEGSVAGIRRLHEIGCEIVRVTVPSMAHASALAEIKDRLARNLSDGAAGCRCASQRHENCARSGQACR